MITALLFIAVVLASYGLMCVFCLAFLGTIGDLRYNGNTLHGFAKIGGLVALWTLVAVLVVVIFQIIQAV